jgi:hypothetical protein
LAFALETLSGSTASNSCSVSLKLKAIQAAENIVPWGHRWDQRRKPSQFLYMFFFCFYFLLFFAAGALLIWFSLIICRCLRYRGTIPGPIRQTGRCLSNGIVSLVFGDSPRRGQKLVMGSDHRGRTQRWIRFGRSTRQHRNCSLAQKKSGQPILGRLISHSIGFFSNGKLKHIDANGRFAADNLRSAG